MKFKLSKNDIYITPIKHVLLKKKKKSKTERDGAKNKSLFIASWLLILIFVIAPISPSTWFVSPAEGRCSNICVWWRFLTPQRFISDKSGGGNPQQTIVFVTLLLLVASPHSPLSCAQSTREPLNESVGLSFKRKCHVLLVVCSFPGWNVQTSLVSSSRRPSKIEYRNRLFKTNRR